MDSSYEKAPQLLARYNGADAFKEIVDSSLDFGELKNILESLGKQEISVDKAVFSIRSFLNSINVNK